MQFTLKKCDRDDVRVATQPSLFSRLEESRWSGWAYVAVTAPAVLCSVLAGWLGGVLAYLLLGAGWNVVIIGAAASVAGLVVGVRLTFALQRHVEAFYVRYIRTVERRQQREFTFKDALAYNFVGDARDEMSCPDLIRLAIVLTPVVFVTSMGIVLAFAELPGSLAGQAAAALMFGTLAFVAGCMVAAIPCALFNPRPEEY